MTIQLQHSWRQCNTNNWLQLLAAARSSKQQQHADTEHQAQTEHAETGQQVQNRQKQYPSNKSSCRTQVHPCDISEQITTALLHRSADSKAEPFIENNKWLWPAIHQMVFRKTEHAETEQQGCSCCCSEHQTAARESQELNCSHYYSRVQTPSTLPHKETPTNYYLHSQEEWGSNTHLTDATYTGTLKRSEGNQYPSNKSAAAPEQ